MKILLIEDDPGFQMVVKRTLAYKEHSLLVASTAREALSMLRSTEINLILLDLGLPDEDGLSLCAELQAEAKTADISIIVLSGRGDDSNKVAAFSIGAEDYLVKPVSPLELKARVDAKLKRIQKGREQEEILVRGPLRLHVAIQRAFQLGADEPERDLELTPLEFKLLYQLARRVDHVLSRNQLLDLVWGQNAEVLDRTVDAHISTLRKKLGKLSPMIRSVPGEGYSFSLSRI